MRHLPNTVATRAFIGASLAILCPSVLGLGTSLVVLVSGGSLLISVNTTTYSSVLLLVAGEFAKYRVRKFLHFILIKINIK